MPAFGFCTKPNTGKEDTSKSFAKEVLAPVAEYKGYSRTRQCCNPHKQAWCGRQKSPKAVKMKILLLLMWCGSIYAQLQCDELLGCVCIQCNLTVIPTTISTNVTQLNLAQNSICLDESDRKTLSGYPNLTKLNLSENKITNLPNNSFAELSKLEVLILKNNYITTIEEMSFYGLENLQILDLGYNQIAQLPTNTHLPFQHLQVLNLQNNSLINLDINEALKDLKSPLNITLSGNPWNCDCSLMNLSTLLNENTVILENENNTLCATPENMTTVIIKAIKTAAGDILNCGGSSDVPRTTPLVLYSTNSTSAPLSTVTNGTNTTTTKGNSWTFLVGVVIVGIVTSLLILAAVKFPRWYDYLLSYNHHRLKEEEPYMFEEEFNVDLNMSTNINDETVIVFEQTHSFVPEEDGFIEDKYIDEQDMRAES
ncbi:leucine-rich repeat-containing protein 19 [Mixophyes fleayi]|uniref:leucine-rich repeat-containing protein 19 n=1 Tax=Mixophyes fleayi TaxID=3061075 RepID=UPI003F4E078E